MCTSAAGSGKAQDVRTVEPRPRQHAAPILASHSHAHTRINACMHTFPQARMHPHPPRAWARQGIGWMDGVPHDGWMDGVPHDVSLAGNGYTQVTTTLSCYTQVTTTLRNTGTLSAGFSYDAPSVTTVASFNGRALRLFWEKGFLVCSARIILGSEISFVLSNPTQVRRHSATL